MDGTSDEPSVNIVVGNQVINEVQSILKPRFRGDAHPYQKFVGSERRFVERSLLAKIPLAYSHKLFAPHSEHEAKHGRAPRNVTLVLPKGFKERDTSRVSAHVICVS